MVCDLLVMERFHMEFQRIFNNRPEHLVFRNRYLSIDYTYNSTINELLNVGLPTGKRILVDYLSKLMILIHFSIIIM